MSCSNTAGTDHDNDVVRGGGIIGISCASIEARGQTA
jgi:hypothetical protein